MINSALIKIQLVWVMAFSIAHFIGKFLVICLFIFSSTTVINLFFTSIGYPNLISFIVPFGGVYGETLPWAATSMLLASTVAIGHMRNLEINEEKLTTEMMDRIEKETQKRLVKDKEKLETFKFK